MKKEDVPQEFGLNAGCQEVNYAVDAEGRYTLEQSTGWEVKTIALQQAWDAIADQLRQVLVDIDAGKKSSLAYYMVKNQMDTALLAQYSGVSRWRVKRHLKPAIFNKLAADKLAPYAELFGVNVDQLRTVPNHPDQMFNEAIPNRDE
ncbi:hypothetical protein [uncultured Desulfuromusa sp.]|uniref:hypothetical protein n=1 Tax=uncultured Desulfuromusa sp. TaxID=219183 RepID=UPI002AA7A4E3|nr:hypothetical protein [uncultured Desulfuromusa sp.]